MQSSVIKHNSQANSLSNELNYRKVPSRNPDSEGDCLLTHTPRPGRQLSICVADLIRI